MPVVPVTFALIIRSVKLSLLKSAASIMAFDRLYYSINGMASKVNASASYPRLWST